MKPKRLITCCLVMAVSIATSAQMAPPAGDVPAFHAAPPAKGQRLPAILAGLQLSGPSFQQPVQANAYKAAAKVPKVMKPPVGEVYHSIEAPKGELGYFIVSDGSTQPYRVRVRPPSFVNLQALDVMCRDQLVADVIAVIGTLDIVLGEVDR